MSVLSRSIPLVALVCAVGASALVAQDQHRNENFQWYVGGQAGVFIYKTPSQSRGANPMVGAHTLIKAKRTGLMLSMDEVMGTNQTSSFSSTAAPGGTEPVTFNDIRRYSATLMAFPIRGPMQPYLGAGLGIMHVVNPQPAGNTTDTERDYATQTGSTGFGTLVGGLQINLGRIVAFGQYQVTTGARNKAIAGSSGTAVASGHLIDGATHSLSGGLRFSLGRSREEVSGY